MKKTYVLITGASSGLGSDFAILAAKAGLNTVLVARREDKLKEIASELRKISLEKGSTADHKVVSLDLIESFSTESVDNLFKEHHFSHLINNAGFGLAGPFHKQNRSSQENMISLNVTALTSLAHRFLSQKTRANQGDYYLLNVASVAAFVPGPNMAVYYASKAYVHSFSLALTEEYKATPFNICSLCPGSTETEFFDNKSFKEAKIKRLSRQSSYEVANKAWDDLHKGKSTSFPSFSTKAMRFIGKVTPDFLSAKMVARINS